MDLTTISSLRACRTLKTVVKRKFLSSPIDPFVTSCVSDAQNCGKTQIFYVAERPFHHFGRVGRSKRCVFVVCGGVVAFLWWCGGVLVFLWWCFFGGVLVVVFFVWCGGVFVVVLWLCFCGGVVVFLWLCFCGGVLWWCFCGAV